MALDDELRKIAGADQNVTAIENMVVLLWAFHEKAISEGFSRPQAFDLTRTFLTESIASQKKR